MFEFLHFNTENTDLTSPLFTPVVGPFNHLVEGDAFIHGVVAMNKQGSTRSATFNYRTLGLEIKGLKGPKGSANDTTSAEKEVQNCQTYPDTIM